jgi:hypothetical protein
MPKNTERVVAIPLLTLARMDESDWEAALSLPIPADASSELLFKARDQVLEYILWVMSDGLTAQKPDWVRDEIGRACKRLVELADVLPAILDVELKANVREQQERAHFEYFGKRTGPG